VLNKNTNEFYEATARVASENGIDLSTIGKGG
jgi:hypothetical protein